MTTQERDGLLQLLRDCDSQYHQLISTGQPIDVARVVTLAHVRLDALEQLVREMLQSAPWPF